MKVIFAGGGTGGHLYPAIAIAEELRSKGVPFHFFVSDRGIDSKILTRLGYPHTEQNVTPFAGKGLTGKVKSIWKLIVAVIKLFPMIKRGDKVILTGGFAAAPAAAVAKLKGCELYLHEQNSVMGLVNRTFAKLAKKVFLSFKETVNAKGNTIITGNPVRRIFKRMEQKKDFTDSVLILGGSQGSRTINKLIVKSIDKIVSAGFNATHQTGEGLYRETTEAYGQLLSKYSSELVVRPYIDGVAAVMSETDIVIGRSGAGSVFELLVIGCPAVYIPFKEASDNHQYHNAMSVVNSGGALILEEDSATPDMLMKKLMEIRDNIEKFKSNLRETPKEDSAKRILKEIGIE